MLMCPMVLSMMIRGEVVHIAISSDNTATHILVKFDNNEVGAKASHFRNYTNAVPLTRHETVFLAKGKCGSEITRVQFPLTLPPFTKCKAYPE